MANKIAASNSTLSVHEYRSQAKRFSTVQLRDMLDACRHGMQNAKRYEMPKAERSLAICIAILRVELKRRLILGC